MMCLLMLGGYFLPSMGVSVMPFALVPQQLSTWSLLTSCFLHVSATHLAGNILWLLVFGVMVEQAVRRYEYLLVLICGAIAASLVQAVVVLVSQPDRASSPIMGASGIVAAVIGVFAVRYFAVDVRIGRVSIPALWVIALWLIPQLVGAVRTLAEGRMGNVGYWGHLGGFITGLVLALALRMTRAGVRTYLTQQLMAAQARGDALQALRIAEGWCRLEPESIQSHLTAARMAQSAGDDSLAGKYYQQSLMLCELQNDVKEGVQTFLEMRQHLHPLPRELGLRWSLRAGQAGYWQEALESLQQLAETAVGTPEGENALLQSARIVLQQLRQPDSAIALLERFREQYPHSSLTSYALELLRQAREASSRNE